MVGGGGSPITASVITTGCNFRQTTLSRFYAVRGLALITGEQEWTPNEMDFRADPQRYLKYWKAKMQRP